jgi:multiple sugar transport system substrate-binding protein
MPRWQVVPNNHVSAYLAWLDPHANKISNGYFASTLPVLENAWLRPRFAGFGSFQVEALTTVGQFLNGRDLAATH